jgi:HEAT repeat protein
MDEKPVEPVPPSSEKPVVAPKKRSTVKSLILLVACCGAFAWAFVKIRDELKPTANQARLLRSSDLSERLDGIRQLGDVKPESIETAAELLVATATDQDEKVRGMAIWSLGNLTQGAIKAQNKPVTVKTAQALSTALGDTSKDVRLPAIESISQLAKVSTAETFPVDRASVVSTLVGLLNDPEERVRKSSGMALGQFASSQSMEPPSGLIDVLDQAKLADSRVQAASALGSFKAGTEPAIKALIRALKDSDPVVRMASAIALGKFGLNAASALPSLVELAGDSYVPPSPPPPDPNLPPGIVRVRPAPPEPDPPVEAVKAIGQIVEAMSAKGEFASNEVSAALLKCLKTGRDPLKNAAADVFRRVRKGASAAVPELVVDLTESIPKPESTFGPIAASTLGDIGPGSPRANEAIAALISALDAKVATTRSNAVAALGRFGPASIAAMPRLKELAEADKDLAAPVKMAIDRIEGKIPPDPPRRRGGGGGGGRGRPTGGGGAPAKQKGA